MALPQALAEMDKDCYTEDEYFEVERLSFERWEFVGGKIRMMSGGRDDHNAIAMNVGGTLRGLLMPRGCRVYGSDMKVHTGDGTNTYPDVSVVCGERHYHRGRADIILNPVLVVEVLSESTEGYDRGDKFDHYQTIPTLGDYLLVAQDEARVMLFSRDEGGWRFQTVTGREQGIALPSVGVTLALADVYALIEFAP